MKKKVFAALILTLSVLAACGKGENVPVARDILPESSTATVKEPEPADDNDAQAVTSDAAQTEPEEEAEPEIIEEEIIPENSYRSELTNEWIDESIRDQRPIAVMVDNEIYALPHYGLTEADVVYEIMNSTANDRITRFMAIVKDWQHITQFGSVRSVRPTNFYLAVEWNAVICHDGGPFYIKEWIARDYTNNFSGNFARYSNGKATEFTEYITYEPYYNAEKGKSYDGLKQRFEKSKYTTTYNEHYPGPHFTFADNGVGLASREDAVSAVNIELPFKHNKSNLKYNEATGTYDYYEYGKQHLDALHDNAPLTFKNVIIQNAPFSQLDQNGYLIYNAIDNSGRDGYYVTEGKAIPITWKKASEKALTVFYDKATGEEIRLNTGKTYITLVPSDTWSELVIE